MFKSLIQKMNAEKKDSKLTARDIVFDGKFEVTYQPQIDLKDQLQSVSGLDVHLNFPVRAPSEKVLFVTERCGLADKLTIQVLRRIGEAFNQPPEATISLNISLFSLDKPSFADDIIKTLKPYNLNIDNLAFEITETQRPLSRNKTVINNLRNLKANGATIVLDNFGVGRSNFDSVLYLPIDTIKIDKSLITNSMISPKSQKIVQSIIYLADSMGLKVTAEGVESMGNLLLMTSLGCHFAQGNHIAKPLSYEHLDTFFKFYNKKRKKLFEDSKALHV